MIETPERFDGTTPQEVGNKIYSYLWRMVEQLNLAVNQIDDIASFTSEMKNELSAEAMRGISDSAEQLKSLIIKNADYIKAEMEGLRIDLEGTYVAQSEFGTYKEDTSARFEATSESLTQYYQFISEMDTELSTSIANTEDSLINMEATVDDVVHQFTTFKNESEAYIKSGIVDYDGANPIYGVAVGQDLIVSIDNGEQVIEKQKFRSIFTSTKLGFWQDDTEVAYLENNKLYVPQIHLLGTMIHGNFRITSDDLGYSIKWINS